MNVEFKCAPDTDASRTTFAVRVALTIFKKNYKICTYVPKNTKENILRLGDIVSKLQTGLEFIDFPDASTDDIDPMKYGKIYDSETVKVTFLKIIESHDECIKLSPELEAMYMAEHDNFETLLDELTSEINEREYDSVEDSIRATKLASIKSYQYLMELIKKYKLGGI